MAKITHKYIIIILLSSCHRMEVWLLYDRIYYGIITQISQLSYYYHILSMSMSQGMIIIARQHELKGEARGLLQRPWLGCMRCMIECTLIINLMVLQLICRPMTPLYHWPTLWSPHTPLVSGSFPLKPSLARNGQQVVMQECSIQHLCLVSPL
jgi:hypothetical protein